MKGPCSLLITTEHRSPASRALPEECIDLSVEHVVEGGKRDYGAVHDNAPVHGGRINGGGKREKHKDEEWREETQGSDIDRRSSAAERPAAWRKRFTTE